MKFKLFGLVFSVTTQKTVKVPPIVEESEDRAKRIIPDGSDKIFYMVAKVAYSAGAFREHLRSYPENLHDQMMYEQFKAISQLWQQFKYKSLHEKEQTNELE